ncbi:hypothetical protein MMC29_002182 [Sticta canariensis]|nr:hypothetical protein [Sticta canariensis]
MPIPAAIMLLLGLLAMNIGQRGVQAQNVIKVTVGFNGTLLFKPRSMHAEAGDFILFDFYNSGMVGVINQRAQEKTIETFANVAAIQNNNITPGGLPRGGILIPVAGPTSGEGLAPADSDSSAVDSITVDRLTPVFPSGTTTAIFNRFSTTYTNTPSAASSSASVSSSSIYTRSSASSSAANSPSTLYDSPSPSTSSFFIIVATYPPASIPTFVSFPSFDANNSSITIEPISVFDLSRPSSVFEAQTSASKKTTLVPALSQATRKMDKLILQPLSVWGAFVLAATWYQVVVGL